MPTDRMIEILLVEDDPGDAKLMCRALKNSNLELRITIVADGDQALTFLWRQDQYAMAPKPDLILLDLHLPCLTGSEVVAKIEQDPLLRMIPIVILTSASEPFRPNSDLSAVCCVPKPTDRAELVLAVGKIEAFWRGVN
jgi:chemotaxis family two-component system response regulator Rcp1